MDLLVTCLSNVNVVLVNSKIVGSTFFDAPAAQSSLGAGGTGAVAADFSGSGRLEVVVMVKNGAPVLYRNQAGPGAIQWSAAPNIGLSKALASGRAIVAGDVDGDGDTDLILADQAPPNSNVGSGTGLTYYRNDVAAAGTRVLRVRPSQAAGFQSSPGATVFLFEAVAGKPRAAGVRSTVSSGTGSQVGLHFGETVHVPRRAPG